MGSVCGMVSLSWSAGCAGLAGSLALLTAQITGGLPAACTFPLRAGCRLDSRAVRRAVQAGCSAVPGVVGARCRLTSRGRTMGLGITLTVDGTAHLGDVLTGVSDGVLPQIASLLTPRRLQTRIRLHVQRPRRPHRAL